MSLDDRAARAKQELEMAFGNMDVPPATTIRSRHRRGRAVQATLVGVVTVVAAFGVGAALNRETGNNGGGVVQPDTTTTSAPTPTTTGPSGSDALAFLEQALAGCASRGVDVAISEFTVVESRADGTVEVVHASDAHYIVDAARGIVYGTDGPDGVLPRPLMFCTEDVFVGTTDEGGVADPSSQFPEQAAVEPGDVVWGVILAGGDDLRDPGLLAGETAAENASYGVSPTDCWNGAREALGIDTDPFYSVTVPFLSEELARQALAAFEESGYEGAAVGEVEFACS